MSTPGGSSLTNKLSIDDLPPLKNKRILIRVDFNVPQDKSGNITSRQRILAALPTIRSCLIREAAVVTLLSHLGRPDGRKVSKFSLKPVAAVLQEELSDVNVIFVPVCVGRQAESAIRAAPHGSVVLLENVRFHIEEEGTGIDEHGKVIKADKQKVNDFRAQLSQLGDIFVNDAFGTAHRAHR